MDTKQSPQLGQKFILSQSLIQSVKILELPIIELKAMIANELEQNPVLDEVSRAEPGAEPPIRLDRQEKYNEAAENTEQDGLSSQGTEDYEKPIPNRKESLQDHLARQLRINSSKEEVLSAGMSIIARLDGNGYLPQSPESIAEESGTSPETVLETLRLIQSFEPAGVGSRNLKECLLLQLERAGNNDKLLRCLVEEHLEDLAAGLWQKILKKLKCSPEELEEKVAKIHRLEPKPGRFYSDDATLYIVPDLTVEEKDGNISVSAREENVPVIRINPLYRSMLKNKKIDDTTKEFIRQKIANGSSLINAIRNRRQMLVNVLEIIAGVQKEALLEGLEKLKPLSLKEISEVTGIHESTVSRIVMNKYVQTPAGIYPLRSLFSSSLKRTDGEDVSSQGIRLIIKELIDGEDKQRPLRDEEIAKLLEETEKIRVARRTIVKYRLCLGLPSASKRRKQALQAGLLGRRE